MKQYYWNVTGSLYRQSNLTFPFCKRSFWSWRQSWGTKSLLTTSSWTTSFHCPLPLASHSSSPWLEWCRLVPEEAWPSPLLVWVIVVLHPVLALSLSQELTATLFFPWQTDLSFMPSFGLEFITHMGVHVPDFVDAGLEMHTSAYHESSLNAKISMKRNQIRLSIPAPRSNTKLLTFRSVWIHRHWFCLDFVLIYLFFSDCLVFETQQQAAVHIVQSNSNCAATGRGPHWLQRLPTTVQWFKPLHNSALLWCFFSGRSTILPTDRRNKVS